MSYLRTLVSLFIGSILLGSAGCAASAGWEGDVGDGEGGEEVASQEEEVSGSPTSHRIVTNGLPASRLIQHREALIDLAERDLSPKSVAASPLIETDQGRELLGYVVKCALGWDETLVVPYYGKNFVFEGGVGLGEKWAGGGLSPSDQRWISACLLAHANAHGIEVPLSLRGHHPALATTLVEEEKYTVEEGAFYGNLLDASDIQAPMFACSGLAAHDTCELGSNTWLQARLCASAGGEVSTCGFTVPGDCYDFKAAAPVACEEADASGYSKCHPMVVTSVGGSMPSGYEEVITVYLMQGVNTPCITK